MNLILRLVLVSSVLYILLEILFQLMTLFLFLHFFIICVALLPFHYYFYFSNLVFDSSNLLGRIGVTLLYLHTSSFSTQSKNPLHLQTCGKEYFIELFYLRNQVLCRQYQTKIKYICCFFVMEIFEMLLNSQEIICTQQMRKGFFNA